MAVITNSIPMAVFGPGSLYVTRNDIADQTPVNIGYAQEFSYDEAADSKELYGQNQYPLVIARGTIKATGKVKAATVSGMALNAAFNGQTYADGYLQMAQRESQVVPAVVTKALSGAVTSGSTLTFANTTSLFVGMLITGHANIADGSYIVSKTGTQVVMNQAVEGTVPDTTTITFGPSITPTHYSDFDTDLGVISNSTGLPYAKAAAGTNPGAGQYFIDPTGIYSFHSSAIGATALLTYAYETTGAGQSMTIENTPIGNTPTFQLDYCSSLYGKAYYVRMFACVSNKLTRSHKLTDYMMPEIDFGFFATAAGLVYRVTYPEIS